MNIDYVKKMRQELKEFNYPEKVRKIQALRKILEIEDNADSRNILLKLETDVKKINAACSILNELETMIISHKHLQIDSSGKKYPFQYLCNITGYSLSHVKRIEAQALYKLYDFKYGNALENK